MVRLRIRVKLFLMKLSHLSKKINREIGREKMAQIEGEEFN